LKLTEPNYMFCGTLGFRGNPVEEHWFRTFSAVVLKLGSIEPLGFDGAISGFDEGHLKHD